MSNLDLIIGGCTGYNYSQLKPWVESIDEIGFQGDKVMVVGDMSPDTADELKKRNFQLIQLPSFGNAPIHVTRFIGIYEYLRQNYRKYRYVVTTDVKDVYFQTNPFRWLEEQFLPGLQYAIVAGSESMLYKDEPWGNQNLLQAYGPYIHDLFKNNEIYNVGTIGGRSEYVKDLVFNIFSNAVNRPISVVDQAVYNVLLQTQPYKNVTFFAQQKDGWACQAGTTVDPSKIEQFRPLLTEEEPIFENGLVKTSKGIPFCIVHQYDRVPEWKKFIEKKYGQEDTSQYFFYKGL